MINESRLEISKQKAKQLESRASLAFIHPIQTSTVTLLPKVKSEETIAPETLDGEGVPRRIIHIDSTSSLASEYQAVSDELIPNLIPDLVVNTNITSIEIQERFFALLLIS